MRQDLKSRGREVGNLLVRPTDSWQACHEFKLSTGEDPPCRGSHCTLNLSRLARPSVDVVWKLRKGGASSGVVFVTCPGLKVTRFITDSPRVVL
ncbi:hypothetical protein TNCV_2759391 [Trichonephila clavipes]|nr:hypothetical protein TNCV_2759391 [Trichonephila clavipes]